MNNYPQAGNAQDRKENQPGSNRELAALPFLTGVKVDVTDIGNPITLVYTNYRGETSERIITPIKPWFGSTEWHPEPQWLLTAFDHEKQANRDFALKDFGYPAPSPRAQALADLEEIQRAVFGTLGSEPDVYADYDRLCELSRKMREAIRALSYPDHADAGKVEGDGWLQKAGELYDRCKLFPETSAEGFTALLQLRNHVAEILPSAPASEGAE